MAVTLGNQNITSSTGNLGIGTDSPTSRLDVAQGSSSFVISDANGYPRFTHNGGSAQLGLFRTGNSVGGGYIGGDDANCLAVRNSALSTRVQISQAGHVTMPNQPAFNVFYDVTSVSIAANTIFVFNGARRNVGGHFNLSTNRFTAPVAGNYWFTFETIQIGNLTNGQFNFRKNGSDVIGTFRHFSNSTGGWITIGGTSLKFLNAGDFIEVRIGTATTYHGGSWNAFCGYLIG